MDHHTQRFVRIAAIQKDVLNAGKGALKKATEGLFVPARQHAEHLRRMEQPDLFAHIRDT